MATDRSDVGSLRGPTTTKRGIRSAILKLSLKRIAKLLRTGDEHATIDRLFASKHVQDLQLIIALSCAALFLTAGVGIGLAVWNVVRHVQPYQIVVKCLQYGGPVLIVFGGVISWVYKTGSSRLGVVDLFACEISVICRVMKVTEVADQCVCRVDQHSGGHSTGGRAHVDGVHPFTSAEDYFPVFTSNNQALETLEAEVVVNITEFYTYMKAFRDSLRALAQLGAATGEANGEPARDSWATATTQSLYVLFLGLESARKAIFDLIEFEPEQAENMILVLLSELVAFKFLRRKYFGKHDIYNKRIELRVPGYEQVVPDLKKFVECRAAEAAKSGSPDVAKWDRSTALLDELWARYEAAISKFSKTGPPQSPPTERRGAAA